MKRVCHLTSAHPSEDIRIFHKECSSLSKNGYSVSLIAVDCEEKILNGVNIISVKSTGKGRLNRILKTTKSVYQKALEVDADVYHFHDPELLLYAIRLVKKGKKVVYDVHEDVPKQIMDKHWIPKLIRGFISVVFAWYEKYVVKRITGVISVTTTICDRFRKVNSNVELVANYPLLEETTQIHDSSFQKKPRQICYIGGLFPARGVKELVASLENIDAKLVLAGTFSPVQFGEEVKQLAGWEKVEYLGQVNREKIMEVLKTSNLGVVTLHPTRSYVEALPIKMFEYMSAGIPVLASDFPLWRGIIDDAECGICVDPLNVEAISKGIEYLLNHADEANKMGENGEKAYKTKYNWTVEEGKLLNFYAKLFQ